MLSIYFVSVVYNPIMDHTGICKKMEALKVSYNSPSASSNFGLYSNKPDNSAEVSHFQTERLMQVLRQQEIERNDTSFSRSCLFCKAHFTGNRSNLFQHLLSSHNFHIGSPDNVVFFSELLDILSEKLKNLQCLYCEKIFRDWAVLKEHMRKKQHKLINPRNKAYDRFYMINYLDLDVTWPKIQEVYNSEPDSDSEREVMECGADEENCKFICLFCENMFTDISDVLSHMKALHKFDYKALRDNHHLDFYKQVKLVNYIRRQVSQELCIFCEEHFDNSESLLEHMYASGHITLLPDSSKWDQAMYYFPTYEDDNFLCALDDDDSDITTSFEPVVVPEDIKVVPSSLLSYSEIMEM